MSEVLRTDTPKRLSLPPGNILSVDATAGSGHTAKLDHPGAQANTLKAIAAGTTFRIGPYPATTYHYIAPAAGQFTITELPASPPLPISGTPTDFVEMFGDGAPVDYTDGTPPATGEAVAGKGSRYTDLTNAALYINTGTKAEPAWTQLAPVE